MTQATKRLFSIASNVVIIAVVLLAVLLAGVRLIGFEVFTVLSGSMEPAFSVGSLIYVHEVDTSEIDVGDAITFLLSEDTIATHRVIEVIEEDATYFRTKGDANDTADANLVHENNVIGKALFSIPLLGYLANYLQSISGIYLILCVAALLLFLILLPEAIKALSKSDDTQNDTLTQREEENNSKRRF